MVGQCHRSYQNEFDQTLGGSGRWEGLACSGPWGHKESDMTKQLNNNVIDVSSAADKRVAGNPLSKQVLGCSFALHW